MRRVTTGLASIGQESQIHTALIRIDPLKLDQTVEKLLEAKRRNHILNARQPCGPWFGMVARVGSVGALPPTMRVKTPAIVG